MTAVQEIDAWSQGVALAIKMLAEAENQSGPMGMDPEFRTAPQRNFVQEYLTIATNAADPAVIDEFTAALSDYVSACQSGGVPELWALRTS